MKLVQHPNVVRLYEVKIKVTDPVSFRGNRIHSYSIKSFQFINSID